MLKTKLSKKEYILKAAKLCGVEKVELEALKKHLDGKLKNPYVEERNLNLFKLYELYEKEEYHPLEIDEEGIINLNKNNLVISKKKSEKTKFGKFFVITPKLNSYIATMVSPYDIPEKFERIAELNDLLLPRISNEMGVPATEYYRSIYKEKTTETANHLTKNFLNDDEILIPGNKIIRGDSKKKEKRPRIRRKIKLESILESTDKYIKKNYDTYKFSKEETDSTREEIRKGLIKQTVVNKFFVVDDEPFNSWGLIKNKQGKLKLAPLSKFFYCAGVVREAPDLKHIVTSTGKEDIQSFILEYGKEPWFREWVENKVLKVEFDECVQKMEQDSKISLTEAERGYYKYFFDNMKENVKEVVEANYDKDKLPNRRKRISNGLVEKVKKGFQKSVNEPRLPKLKIWQKINDKNDLEKDDDSEMSQEMR